MSTSRQLLAAVAALTSITATLPSAAESQIEETVVTGQRQAYRGDVPIAETPQAITVLDGDLIERAELTGLAEVLDLSASMARQNNFGGLWDNFATRGFAGDENQPSGYLVNGFNAGRGFGGPRDVSSVERVEILKGPNAALFGRGEPGGTINLVSKQPQFTPAAAVSLTGGSFDTWRATADVTGGLRGDGAGGVAARITGFRESADSFRDTVESKRWALTPSLLWQASESTSLSWEGEFTHQEIPFDRGIPAIGGDIDAVSRRRFLGEPGDDPIEAEVRGHQVQLQHEFNADWHVLAGVSTRETSLEGFSSEAELVTSRQALTRDGRSLSRQRRYRDYDSEYTVYRAELSGRFDTGAFEHHVLAGVDRDKFVNSQNFLRFRPPSLSTNPTPAQGYVIDVFDPVYGRFTPPTVAPQTLRRDEQEAWGAYVQDHVNWGESLHFRAGGRFDSFEQASTNRFTGAHSGDSESRFSPQVGVVYDVSPEVSLYVAYGEGFRQNAGADVAGDPFDPEESKSLEAGVRLALFDGALSASISVFDMAKTNIVTADPGNPGFSIAIGEASSRGAEIDVTGRLPGEVQVLFSYAYVDAQAEKRVLDPNFALVIEKGDRLINIPEHSASLLLSRDFAVGGGALTLGAGAQYVGDRLGETATDFELPDYTIVRLLARYAYGERWEVAGEYNNLFDETYYTNSFAQLWVAPGAPRNGAITVRYRM